MISVTGYGSYEGEGWSIWFAIRGLIYINAELYRSSLSIGKIAK